MKKTFKYLITTIIMFLGLISFQPAVASALSDSSASNLPVPITNPYTDEGDHYHQLTLKSMAAGINQNQYDAILEALLDIKDEMWVPDYTGSQEVFDTLYQVLDDHPEIFFFQAQGSQLWSNGRWELKYKYPKVQIQEMQSTLSQKVTDILEQTVKPGATSLENELGLHDYMISHTKYDRENYDNDSIPDLDYTAYGTLINGTGVCDGYSKAMQLLLTQAGIECIRITGEVSGGGGHAWNLVNLDGEWYHLDSTWDDPVPDTRTLRYTYFNQSDSVMNRNHAWDTDYYPAASSEQFAYFNSMSYATRNDDCIYYSDSLDYKLYSIGSDGSGKICFDVKAIYPTLDGEWIYFSNFSCGGYLYKVKTDGTELTRLNSFYSTKIYRVGRILYYTDHETQEELSLELDLLEIVALQPISPVSVNTGIACADLPLPATLTVTLSDGSESNCNIYWDNCTDYNPNPATSTSYIFTGDLILPDDISNPYNLKASVVVNVTVSEADETWIDLPSKEKSYYDYWTITFNKEVDPSSVNNANIFVATDEAGTNRVKDISLAQPDGNACQVMVMPTDNGWQDADTYYLFISSRVKSTSGGQTLKNGVRMKFKVTP